MNINEYTNKLININMINNVSLLKKNTNFVVLSPKLTGIYISTNTVHEQDVTQGGV